MASITVAQTLRSFVRGIPGAKNRCFMMVYPNPLFWTGLRRRLNTRTVHQQTDSPNESTYLLSFGRGHDDVMASGRNAWANSYNSFQARQDKLEFSRWISILDVGKTSSTEKTLRETLVEALEMFPHYNLDSKRGIESAARELDSRIQDVSGALQEAKEIVGQKVAVA
ncbi:hypothetical protein VNI00_012371 [Paramarasmius palmivorus]|uniref:Uncharacterized protein n=1 Tax=Paramarasmius palmivorus TaxID=297713 RepID=A0AAW0C6M9_9AGAR